MTPRRIHHAAAIPRGAGRAVINKGDSRECRTARVVIDTCPLVGSGAVKRDVVEGGAAPADVHSPAAPAGRAVVGIAKAHRDPFEDGGAVCPTTVYDMIGIIAKSL